MEKIMFEILKWFLYNTPLLFLLVSLSPSPAPSLLSFSNKTESSKLVIQCMTIQRQTCVALDGNEEPVFMEAFPI